MEPLLPSLHNLPVFFTVVISLLIMAGVSAIALYRQLRQQPPGPRLAWLKGMVLLPLWVLTLIWTGWVAAMGVFTGGMTGSWLYPLLGLLVLPVFALLTWGLYFWSRGRRLADASVPCWNQIGSRGSQPRSSVLVIPDPANTHIRSKRPANRDYPDKLKLRHIQRFAGAV